MQSVTCSRCGAPLLGGAQFCSYCGAPAAPPLAAGGLPVAPVPAAPAPLPSGFEATAGPSPRPRRSHRLLVILVVVVVVVAAAGLALFLLVPAGPAVQVGAIDIWAPDNVCGLGTNSIYYEGYNASTGEAISLELYVPNYNGTSCTVSQVTTNTSGFTLSGVQTGVVVPAHGNATLNLTIGSPSSSFSGTLNLVFH